MKKQRPQHVQDFKSISRITVREDTKPVKWPVEGVGIVPVYIDRVLRVNGVDLRQFVKRLNGIEMLTQIYSSEDENGVDAVLAMDLAIVKALCNAESRECRILLYHIGHEDYALPSKPTVGDVTKAIFSAAALAHGVAWYAMDPLVGSTCPHCKATYKYSQEMSIDDSNLQCQNCGKVFDAQETLAELPPTSELGELTKCTFCGAQYVYNENDLDEERTAACQNCGVRIAFASMLKDW